MSSLFERCYAGGGNLCDKAELLYRELQSSPPPYYDGLRMTLLEGVKPVTKVRLPSGEVRDMLMLGSNSFLNLNWHPKVLEAERIAAEKYGSGAGSPPLYAGTTDIHRELEEELAAQQETKTVLEELEQELLVQREEADQLMLELEEAYKNLSAEFLANEDEEAALRAQIMEAQAAYEKALSAEEAARRGC